MSVCSCISIGLHLRARLCSTRVCVRVNMCAFVRAAAPCGALSWLGGDVIDRPATRGRPRLRACMSAIGRSRALDAGVTWTSRTSNAQWAGRQGHTSVVDAAGAIYVIGGGNGDNAVNTFYHDVWVSTDGGARPDSGRERSGGTRWVIKGTKGYQGGTARVLQEY
jgi:hypothetical protein